MNPALHISFGTALHFSLGIHTNKRWYHPLDENPPARYTYGPLTGRQNLLAKAICPVFGYKPDRRSLHSLAEEGSIYVAKAEGHQVCTVWFPLERHYKEANANMLSHKSEQ